jgi:hypothetical protein
MSEAGLRTPLLDFFRRGDVTPDVKLAAAQGKFATRALEQLGLLMLLSSDSDKEIRDAAEATLAQIPIAVLSKFIARSDVPLELRDFFVKRGVAMADAADAEIDQPLVDKDDNDYGKEPETEADKASTVTALSKMSVPERVKAAIKGTREMRAILVRDPNRMVSLAVLSSPRLNDTEVESIARMGSVSEDVLRTIGQTRAWVKNYNVVTALVKNAKTPLTISLGLLQRLNEGDCKRLSTDRNIPEPLRIAARKRIVQGDRK